MASRDLLVAQKSQFLPKIAENRLFKSPFKMVVSTIPGADLKTVMGDPPGGRVPPRTVRRRSIFRKAQKLSAASPKWFLIMSNIVWDPENMFLIVRIYFRVETDNIWDFLIFFRGGKKRRFEDGTPPRGGGT